MLLILGTLLIIGWIAAVTKIKLFPEPSAWLKALGLAVPTWFGAVVVFSLLSWQFIFGFILAVIDRSPVPTVYLVFAAGIFIASLVWYLLLVLMYSLLLRLLRSKVPQSFNWIRPPKSWQAVFFGWVVSTLAALVPALFILPYTFYSSNSSKLILETMQQRGLIGDQLIVIGWYITAAYLYHARSLLKSRQVRRKA